MWILHPTAAMSAVQHRTETDKLFVRFRHHGDAVATRDALESLDAELHPDRTSENLVVSAYEYSDYPYRILVTKTLFAAYVSHLVLKDLNYGNFKSEVDHRQGKARHDVYSRVWGVLLDLTKLPKGKATAKAQKAALAAAPARPAYRSSYRAPSARGGRLVARDLFSDDTPEADPAGVDADQFEFDGLLADHVCPKCKHTHASVGEGQCEDWCFTCWDALTPIATPVAPTPKRSRKPRS